MATPTEKDLAKLEQDRAQQDANTCAAIKEKIVGALAIFDENEKAKQWPSGLAFVEFRSNVTRLIGNIPTLCDNTANILVPAPQPEMLAIGANQVVMDSAEAEQLRAAAAELAAIKQAEQN